MGNAEGPGRRRDTGAAARAEQEKRSGWRQKQRQPQPASEPFDRRIHTADIAQHTWPKSNAIQRQPIALQRRLGFAAANQGVPGVLREILVTLADDFMQGLEFMHAGLGLGSWFRCHGLAVGPYVLHSSTLWFSLQGLLTMSASTFSSRANESRVASRPCFSLIGSFK